jgi:hypothetical protein
LNFGVGDRRWSCVPTPVPRHESAIMEIYSAEDAAGETQNQEAKDA